MRWPKPGTGLDGCFVVLAWMSLVVGAACIALALWFFYNIDPIIQLPFVLGFGWLGGVTVLWGLGYLIQRAFRRKREPEPWA